MGVYTRNNNYKIQAQIVNKGKEYITIDKDNNNIYFHLQKDKETHLSLKTLQTKFTYHQLINLVIS